MYIFAEPIVTFNSQQPSVHNFAIVFLPIVVLLKLLPVPSTNTLAKEALKNDYLTALSIFDKYSDMVVLRARYASYDAILHLFASEKHDIAGLSICNHFFT